MAPISLRRGAKLLPARPKRTDHITCLTHQPSSPDLRPRPSHIDLTHPQMPGTHTRRGSGPSFGRRCPSPCPPDQLPPPSVLSSITRPKISATLHQFIAHYFSLFFLLALMTGIYDYIFYLFILFIFYLPASRGTEIAVC